MIVRHPAWRYVAALLLAALALLPGHVHAQDAAAVTSETPTKVRYECPGCLIEVAPDAERCPECAISFKKLEYQCPRCQFPVEYDTKVCPNCSLAFDAPITGEREKRAARARVMPPSRDFLSNPKAQDDGGIKLTGRSLTLYRYSSRETSFNFRSKTVHRLNQDLSLNVLNLGIPELSFHTDFTILADPQLLPESSVLARLQQAYLRYESVDATFQAQAGRQFVNSGVTREFVDGLYLHKLFGERLGFEVYGGHPVSTDKSDPEGDYMVGTRVYYRGLPKVKSRYFRDLTFGGSFLEERWRWEEAKRYFGFDFSWSPTWNLDIHGHVYYDLIARDFYDARFLFTARPFPLMQLTIDYRYIIPSLLLPKTSIFWVFASDIRHEFEGTLDFFLGERVKLTGTAKLIYIPMRTEKTKITATTLREGDQYPVFLSGAIVYRHGDAPLRGELGVTSSILLKDGIEDRRGASVRTASILQLRVYEMVTYDLADVHQLRGTIDLHFEAYSNSVYDDRRRNNALTATLTTGYTYRQQYAFTIGGAYRRSPDFNNVGDLFAKLEIYF